MRFHYTFANLPADQKKILDINLVGLSEDEQKRLLLIRDGFIARVEENKPLIEAAAIAQRSPAELTRVFNRYATVINGELAGWEKVVSGARLKEYERSEASAANATARNAMGMFTRLLNRRDDARQKLVDLIIERVGKDGRRIQQKVKIRIAEDFALWRAKHVLDEPGAVGGYGASLSSSAVYRFIDDYLDGNVDSWDIWYGKNTKKQITVGTGQSGFRMVTQPFDKVMLDAHRVDVVGCIKIQTEDGPKVLAISCIWLVVLLDVKSEAVLGWSVSYELQVSAATVERAIIVSQEPWVPREGVQYVEGAGLPAGTIKGLDRCPITVLSMDNFSSHYATLIQGAARQSLGFHAMYGGLGAWWTNAVLERFFGILEQYAIHRVSSTTGTGPKDPLKPDNPAKRAIEDTVDWRHIINLLEGAMTELNTFRGSGRSDMSPLEIISNHLRDLDTCIVPAFEVPPSAFRPRLGWEVEERPVAGRREKGVVKLPYVEIDGRYYTNDKLIARPDLCGQRIWVHVRDADFYVEAYLPSGVPLGHMNRCGGEEEIKVSQSHVKQTRKGKNKSRLTEAQLLKQREEGLAEQAAKDAANRPYAISAAATDLANIELMKMHAKETASRHDSSATDAASAERSSDRNQLAPVKKPKPLRLADIAQFGGLRRRK